MSGPLQGVRVIDLTSVAMGPYATQIMGDMGADVIKIESRDGDVFRHAGPARHTGMGAPFLNFNRNKRSVVLDLKSPDDAASLRALVKDADVFVSNVRPKSMARLGLDDAALRALNPRLVYCGAYGFSEQGRYAGRPAFDDIIQAMSGIAAIQANATTGEPAYVNTIIADKTAGLTIAWAVAMALYERERSGLGQAIEVPMFETLVGFGMMEHLAGRTFNPPEGPMGYDRLLSSARRPYRTQDGFIALLPYTTAQWQRFFRLAGQPEVAEDARYMEPAQRSRNIHTLYGMLADMVAQRSTAQWLALLADADIPHSEVLSMDAVMADPHLHEAGMVQQHQHPTEGALTGLGIATRFSRTPGSIRRLAPGLGQDAMADIAAEWSTAPGH
jgi:crotonobetainyl-CoA:carnitine CoA-transferase CaiB-like acyl-CoA transferase